MVPLVVSLPPQEVVGRLRRLGIHSDRESTLCITAPPRPQSDRVQRFLELVCVRVRVDDVSRWLRVGWR